MKKHVPMKRCIHTLKNSNDIKRYLLIIPNIITEIEEESIIQFVQPKLQRKRYENGHWDSVITKYKETEISEYNMPEIVSLAIGRIANLIRESTGTLQHSTINEKVLLLINYFLISLYRHPLFSILLIHNH